MTAERWFAPASAEVETEHARRHARALRAEIAVYQQQIDDWIFPNVPHMACPSCHRSVTLLHPDVCWECTFPAVSGVAGNPEGSDE